MSNVHRSSQALPALSLDAPTPPGARFEIIDIVRGFALFGVLLSNMVWTTQWFGVTESQMSALPTAGLDRLVGSVIVVLVDYKFYTLFSMLFGLGFAMQLSRATESGRNPLGVYSARLTVLIFLGIGHAVFLWFGDILHTYAVVGFVLILFRNRGDRAVLGWTMGIAVVVSLLPFFHWATTGAAGADVNEGTAITELRFAAMTSTNWWDVVGLNWNFLREEYSRVGLEFDGGVYWYLSVFWKFLLGFYLGRRSLLQQSERYLGLFRRILPWAWTLGLTGNAVLVVALLLWDVWIPEHPSALASLAWIPLELSFLALSVAYLATLVSLYHRLRWQRILRILAPVGRMALTNYLSQSVFIVILFYGVGLNLLGKVGTGVCFALSVVLFGLQIVVSAWWLKRFRFGPVEWMWRCLTYGRWQPMRLMPRATFP